MDATEANRAVRVKALIRAGELEVSGENQAEVADDEARIEMAASTPAPYVDAFFRFYSDGEFDDAPTVSTVHEITGHPPRRFDEWARAHADAFA